MQQESSKWPFLQYTPVNDGPRGRVLRPGQSGAADSSGSAGWRSIPAIDSPTSSTDSNGCPASPGAPSGLRRRQKPRPWPHPAHCFGHCPRPGARHWPGYGWRVRPSLGARVCRFNPLVRGWARAVQMRKPVGAGSAPQRSLPARPGPRSPGRSPHTGAALPDVRTPIAGLRPRVAISAHAAPHTASTRPEPSGPNTTTGPARLAAAAGRPGGRCARPLPRRHRPGLAAIVHRHPRPPPARPPGCSAKSASAMLPEQDQGRPRVPAPPWARDRPEAPAGEPRPLTPASAPEPPPE